MKHKLFKVILITLAFFFACSNAATTNAATTSIYKDVASNHWAAKSISTMRDMGVMEGNSNGNFYPNQLVTRAEAVQYIFKALKAEKTAEKNFLFTDVPQDAPYKDSLYTLTTLGVIYDTDKFNPDSYLTRAELCKMITVAFKIQVGKKKNSTFTDVPAKHWAKDYVATLVEIEIVKGTSKKAFSPNQNVTRAQMAVFLDRTGKFQNDLAKNELIYDFLQNKYISTVNQHANWTSKVIELVNKEREKAGVPTLKSDPKLTQLSVIKGNDMIKRNYFEHYSPLYGNAWDMAGVFDYSFVSIGENIAKNYTSPETVVQGWLKSKSHRENMLNKTYTNIGVACVSAKDGQTYWVQIFSKK